MSPPPDSGAGSSGGPSGKTPGGGTPVLKVGLRRLNFEDRVFGDGTLRDAPFIRLLGERAARSLLTQINGRRFEGGSRLFGEGEPGSALLFLMKGEARLLAGAGADTVEVGLAHKGEVLGAREALGEAQVRGYSAQAVGEVEVFEVPPELLAQVAPLGSQVWTHLKEVAATRAAARAELTDFLNRW